MLWICILLLVLGFGISIFIIYAEYTGSYNRADRISALIKGIGIIITSPVLGIVVLIGVLVESSKFLISVLRNNPLRMRENIGLMISDIRWICAINGILQVERPQPIVYKEKLTGKMFYDEGVWHGASSSDVLDVVYPMRGGVVCHFEDYMGPV